MSVLRARLEIIKDDKLQKEFLLDQNVVGIGREEENTVVLSEPNVSRYHAELNWNGDRYFITDLSSYCGTWVNQDRVNPQVPIPLVHGDTIRIGSFDVRFLTDVNVLLPQMSVNRQEATVFELPANSTAIALPTTVLDLRGRSSFSIGRDRQNDIAIEHPTVSRFHAHIERKDGSLYITDLSSTNGTFVNAKPIHEARLLRAGDTIRIGPSRMVLHTDEKIIREDEQGNLRLDAVNLRKVVDKGTTILNDISLSIMPREFVVIAGVSGGGKSTLLDALNGFRPATSGSVLVNSTDLYKNFNAYRTQLGYVPQDDIIHKELTVRQALNFAARLRMPADTTDAERQQRLNEVLDDLELTHRQNVPVKSLSGGQRKRVSIGVELLTKPSLFFLDEATSGLDPGTEAQIMRLLRKLADQGRTILLITHATKNVTMCDLVVFLAKGGRVAYLGPPQEAIQYFGVQEFDEIYDKVEDELSPEEWQKRYKESPQYQKYVVERQSILPQPQSDPQQVRRPKQQQSASQTKNISGWQQFVILSQRNLAILMRDRASLILTLAIAPILGILDFITWQKTLFDPYEGDAGQAITMLFVAVLIAVLVGNLTTMREIVKEVEIYRRERTIGLQILPYILSKVWIGVLLALYQAGIFLLTKKLAVEIPGGAETLANMYVTLVLATIAGMVMGLLVSALSPNQNIAPLLTIIFLVPQITFGGGMLPIKSFGVPGQLINHITLTKWSFEALVTTTELGRDVAEDDCWRLSEAQRKQLTDQEKNQRCQCLGTKLFQSCKFPGLKAKYDPVVAQPEPQKPTSPGDPPSDPQKLSEYKEKVNKYNREIESWQNQYSDWKQKYQTAIGAAEAVIDRFYQDYGETFKVNVTKHWMALSLIVLAMFGILLSVQQHKDIIQ
ncbi:FHA domain-containing protein [Scytonema sp. PCC 10023]|uniref:ABC transporter ATP-binding protein/permease n=1 Tax=Scytonema sp. PCC 10023 TaxID=1680591 RepID=UPI0039C5F491